MNEKTCASCPHFTQEWEESEDTEERFLRDLCRIEGEEDMPVSWNATGCTIPEGERIIHALERLYLVQLEHVARAVDEPLEILDPIEEPEECARCGGNPCVCRALYPFILPDL